MPHTKVQFTSPPYPPFFKQPTESVSVLVPNKKVSGRIVMLDWDNTCIDQETRQPLGDPSELKGIIDTCFANGDMVCIATRNDEPDKIINSLINSFGIKNTDFVMKNAQPGRCHSASTVIQDPEKPKDNLMFIAYSGKEKENYHMSVIHGWREPLNIIPFDRQKLFFVDDNAEDCARFERHLNNPVSNTIVASKDASHWQKLKMQLALSLQEEKAATPANTGFFSGLCSCFSSRTEEKKRSAEPVRMSAPALR